jgi:putative phage-type endonuclease
MGTIVKLLQGSPEWHAHRKGYRNASETPAVLGASPWMTPYQLWQLKTGRSEPTETTSAMKHGTRLEPVAREAYEQLTGHIMEPLVLVEGDYSASLDGITLEGDLILEIKCPMSKDSKILTEARAGRIPESIYWQLQTQLYVSQAALAHLYVYDGTSGILLELKPDANAWDTLREGWDRFMSCVQRDEPPSLTDRDTLLRVDMPWQEAAASYLKLKSEADAVGEKLEAAKQKLVQLASHSSESGGGVTVSRYWKGGTIDYKKVPQLAGVDVESYRGSGREEVRVSAAR